MLGKAEILVCRPDGSVVERAEGTNTVTNYAFWMLFGTFANVWQTLSFQAAPAWNNGQTSIANLSIPDWYDGSFWYRPVNPWAFLYLSTDTVAPDAATSVLASTSGTLQGFVSQAGNTTYNWPYSGASQATNSQASTGNSQQTQTSNLMTTTFSVYSGATALTVGSVGFTPGYFANSSANANITTIDAAANAYALSTAAASTHNLVIASKLVPSTAISVSSGQQLVINYTLSVS